MLEELRISGLGVIDEAVLPLGPGFTVLTGETGAGKTMVVTALLLLFGERADTARIRTGAAQAVVDGTVRLTPAQNEIAARVVDAGGALDEDGSLLLRRSVSAGRSRAVVGGAPAPVGVLAQLADRLLAVHGQSDQLRLSRPAEQRDTLDRYAGVDLAAYRDAYRRWQRAVADLAERADRAREMRREADLLAHGIAEIAAVAPMPAEDHELATEANRLAHADGLRLAARAAHDALLGDPDDPLGDAADVTSLLGQAVRELTAHADADPELDVLAARLGELAVAAADMGADFAAYRDGLDADPARLAQVEARRAAIIALTRRYGEDVAAVLAWAEQSRARLDELDVSDERLAALAAERDEAGARCLALAGELSLARAAAAERLSAAVSDELAGLAMSGASLTVAVRNGEGGPDPMAGLGPDGADEVELLLQPHAGSPAVPISRGASGGELSRVMLALEVCLAGTDPVPTMIFDEVDAGVGGRAAVEVGRRLAVLAADHQVIAVTHLAQVAAFADRHVVVDKPAAQGGVTRSDVRVVEGEDRVTELARMLAGSDSRTAREHASELLQTAAQRTAIETDGHPRRPGAKRARSRS